MSMVTDERHGSARGPFDGREPVKDYDAETGEWVVEWLDGTTKERDTQLKLPRLRVYLRAEDPFNFADRVADAHASRELETEELNRIMALCKRACTAEGGIGDMSGLMEEGTVFIGFDEFQERSRDFCFSSFLTKPEIIKIIVQVRSECLRVLDLSLFHTIPKAVHLEDFVSLQNQTSNEVYGFSKLRRFLAYVNFMTQDTLRFLVQASLDEFVRFLLRACVHDVTIVSSNKAIRKIPVLPFGVTPSPEDGTTAKKPAPSALVGPSSIPRSRTNSRSDRKNDDDEAGKEKEEEEGDGDGIDRNSGAENETSAVNGLRSDDTASASAEPQAWSEGRTTWKGDVLTALRTPLFIVEIVVVGEKGSEVFAYTQKLSAVKESALALIDKAIASTQNMVRVERRVMKKLFWSHDPVMSSVYASEAWVQHLRDTVGAALERAVEPAAHYLETLEPFVEFLNVDVNEYLAETEVAMTKAETGEFLFDDLRELAANHAQQKIEFEKLIPENISLGLFVVSMSKIRQRLSSKHQEIAEKLTLMLSKSVKDQAQASIDMTMGAYAVIGKAKTPLDDTTMSMKWEVFGWPQKVAAKIQQREVANAQLKLTYQQAMEEEQTEYVERLKSLQDQVNKMSHFTDLSKVEQVSSMVRRMEKEIEECSDQAILFNSREQLFAKEVTEYDLLSDVQKSFEPYCDLWKRVDDWMTWHKGWMNDSFLSLDAEEVEKNVTVVSKALAKAGRFFEANGLEGCSKIATCVRDQVDEFMPFLPVITGLRTAGMRDRHWDQLSEKLGVDLHPDDSYTLTMVIEQELHKNAAVITKVSETASKEFAIESALDKMQGAWSAVKLNTEEYRETGTSILKGVDEYMSLLDEHITMTQAMTFSTFKGPFEERIENWNNTLQVVSELIDEWLAVQRNWLYLQPIFDSEDINKQLPAEGKRFSSVDKHWRATMSSAGGGALCIKFCNDPKLLDKFRESAKLLDMVQKGLSDYLETKRAGFSRFYFLSNDELLEILSQTKDPLRVQPHLRKCFEGIKTVDFADDLTIHGMNSSEGEKVPFKEPVNPNGKSIETWMVEVCDMMCASVREQMMLGINDYLVIDRTQWMQNWPGQIVLNGSQVHWTAETEAAMLEAGNEGVHRYYEQLIGQLNDMVYLIRGKLSKMARVTIGALAVIDVHARDVMKKMADAGVAAATDFDWASQMRFYWRGDDETGHLKVVMVSSERQYGYEYLGNSFRLVITPLTDKCYLTIMSALQMILGGAPAGPAGTGKTETTKDLAKALAKQCVVFNCSDGLDYLAMGKFFKGLASSGAWACFDEFNRINIEVLSVIAQQIMTLQGAVQRGEKRVIFEDTDIFVNPDFAVFITMNPGYAGRSALPDNLEALFRPVAMMVPDYALIGEIMLFSFGYLENRKCAQKMVATFRLCSEQLSAQDHYDYGMRAVKTVISAAGNLKRASPEASEEALLLRALQDVNVPKFLAHDLPLFGGILSDLFPGIERPAFDYGPLLNSLKLAMQKQGLQPVPIFLTKSIELYEMICVRHGLMVVGPTGGGKSKNIAVLKEALTHLKRLGVEGERYEKVDTFHLNPKSITMGQLYGEFDDNTHEWQLCLTSGEIMSLSEPMTMMFEPEDLAVASPATVSRCGMIYMEPKSLGFDPLVQSWLAQLPDVISTQEKVKLSLLFDTYVASTLSALRRFCFEPLPSVDGCLVQGLMNILDCYFEEFRPFEGVVKKTPEAADNLKKSVEPMFMFALVWSLLATVDRKGREFMDQFIRGEMRSNGAEKPFPEGQLVYDFCYDQETMEWVPWMDTVAPYKHDPKLEFCELIIPTVDSVRYTYLLNLLVAGDKHVLMTGPTGTGKTVNVVQHLQTGVSDSFDLIDGKCEKRRKGVFGPTAGKKFILFVDDVNMPTKEFYGAQPPIELLRQWFDSGGWYDRKALQFRQIIDVVFVCACGPPGGGRNPVTARFFRHFNIIAYTTMQNDSMTLIFRTIFGNFLERFSAECKALAEPIVSATVGMYNTILTDLRPTPAKSHYTYNLRDLSKVFQGMLMMDHRRVSTAADLCRVWVHETRRVFADRLISYEDKDWFEDLAKKQGHEHLGLDWDETIGAPGTAKSFLMYADFLIPGAEPKVYEEVKDFESLQSTVEEYLGEFNGESKQPMHLVMFGDAIDHVSRISRVIRQPMGNALLLGVGGSGRQSLTRLATFMADFVLFQIEIAKNYGTAEWHEDLKICLMQAGVDDKSVVFLFNDTQIVNEGMLEDVNNILNSGDVPNLYGPEEMDRIMTACRPICAKKRIPATKLNVFAQYINRVRANIHIVLCMSPLGEAFRTRLRMFPSIVNCCTIDWFMEWPDEMVKHVHQSVAKESLEFLAALRRYNYVTPTSYLEVLSTYRNVLNMKRLEVGTLKNRLQVGLDKIISTQEQVGGLQEQLTAMEPVLIKTQAEVEVMIVTIIQDKEEAGKTQRTVESQEAVAQEKAAATKAIADDAQRDLDEALPALDVAVACLKDLKKSDIDEVKSLGKPPYGVKLTMEATCIMFGIKPDKINDPDNPGKKISDWFGAAKKTLLSNANKLLQDMQEFDKDNIPDKVIAAIDPFVVNPDFEAKQIEKASKACTAICLWVRAMHKYNMVAKQVEPKRKLLAEKQIELDVTMAELAQAQSILRETLAKVAALEAQFDEANTKKEKLMNDVEECRARLDRAQKLIGGLGGEKDRWTVSVAQLSKDYDNLVGDVLVSAGMIAYSGPFTPDFRQKLVKGWQEKLVELDIPHSDGCDVRLTLADPVQIRGWAIAGLPSDGHSIENGIFMSLARRYPLLIDPQGQANRYIKNMGKDPTFSLNGIDVIKLTDKNFLRTLENGIRFGRWVLLENVQARSLNYQQAIAQPVMEALDAALEPLLLQQKFKQGGTEMIKVGDSTIPWNDQFRFFMTTKLSNPHYPPEVSVKVSLLNFAITFTGLEDQLLGVVVVEEMPEMQEKKNSLVVANAKMKKELQEIENRILFLLSNSKGNILDDHELIETLASSKKTSTEITHKVAEAEVTEKEIDETREGYRPVAYRGSIMYFCVRDFNVVDPMYQYSLQWFTNLFVQGIRLSEKSDVLEERLEELNNFFTYYVYTNVCRSLFEKDKLLFSFLITVRVLQGDKLIDDNEWSFLISGKTFTPVQAGENPGPDWIDARMWSEVQALAGLPAFEGLAESFAGPLLEDFKSIYDHMEPQSLPLPGEWEEKLNPLQRLCMLRCVRADKMPDAILSYVMNSLGKEFVEPPPFDLESCFQDSTVLTPLIFVLSKGSDPTKAFYQFAAQMRFDKKVKGLSLGQGQGLKATSLIEEASQKGTWVYLQNCHLYISWLAELERVCEELSPETVHKDFRLWLTSMPCKEFPVSILQNGVKMTNEPPKGLKANLKSAYYKLDNNKLSVTSSPTVYKKLLYALCFFHASVQERRKFGPLGWNVPYEFNDTDLDISKGQLEIFLDSYEEVPYRVLNFLTSYINYGGRVTDYIDLRTIDVIMRTFYTPRVLDSDYSFDEDGIYPSINYNDEDPHRSYMEKIETMPMTAGPGVFGLHENANIACALAETFVIFDTILLMESGGGGGGGVGGEAALGAEAKSIEDQLIAKGGQFDIEAITMQYPVVYEESMNTVLVQECIRYNKLIDIMEQSLPELQKALKGLVVMSGELEAVGKAIALNTVPESWEAKAFPSMKPLSAWVVDVMQRIDFMRNWIEKGIPAVFWISGFYFPQAFLTGTLQNFARRMKFAIDTVQFNFVIVDTPWEELSDRPQDGAYIRGLFLEGARWDSEQGSLNDSRPKQLYTPLPVIHLDPEQHRRNPDKGVYRCPVYKVLSRRGTLSTTGHSTNFVMWIDLPSNRADFINNAGSSDQETWVKAGVAAFTSLKY
eukprot:g9495.t1